MYLLLYLAYPSFSLIFKKFNIVIEIPDDEKDVVDLVNKLQSCANVLEAMKSGIEIRKLF